MIDVKEKEILIVGGGSVGLRKSKKLLKEGAYVKVLSKDIHPDFEELKKRYPEKLSLIKKEYKESYLNGAYLVFAATSEIRINEKIRMDCSLKKILCNNTSNQRNSDFYNQAYMTKDDLTISVSTNGGSPGAAKKILEYLESSLDNDLLIKLKEHSKIRKYIIENYKEGKTRKMHLNTLLNTEMEKLKIFRDKLMSEEIDNEY
ncbi:precorrin-2 dehydrogenase/sirohydrochlorin ferrochelatase family protein [Alkalibacter mobilis]|uniref:precorrin-2 dehydrogenase/sirohydrochlorin ferrochelatase family protein n=1 Tax=Alkalibacter mobilis TaxID=2787712 RepID=UPI00189DEB36|nr:bifunctional precorrin-2 dehydrogenase/sirohydrochlorin ferrochelatase [Alkalibacter mobilis]MBF7097164.1 bifunctional precorrin-2 dehydrogenase/sirohydrochlorin ferrochelatase [Alkalibacter mobilis]